MGVVIRKILGDVNTDPEYRDLVIEENANGMVHLHQGKLRLDIERGEFAKLAAGMLQAHEILKRKWGAEKYG